MPACYSFKKKKKVKLQQRLKFLHILPSPRCFCGSWVRS
jgi:hypothetical protein